MHTDSEANEDGFSLALEYITLNLSFSSTPIQFLIQSALGDAVCHKDATLYATAVRWDDSEVRGGESFSWTDNI